MNGTACKSVDEIAKLPPWVGGALLGPVLKPAFAVEPVSCVDLSQLETDREGVNPSKVPLILSGGLDEETLPSVRPFDPAGIAVLGGVWNYADPVNAFIKLNRSRSLEVRRRFVKSFFQFGIRQSVLFQFFIHIFGTWKQRARKFWW